MSGGGGVVSPPPVTSPGGMDVGDGVAVLGVKVSRSRGEVVVEDEEVHQHLFGEKIKPESPERASIWTDTNIYNEMGIPAIKIGPRGRRIGPRNEEIDIDVMVKAAQLYALMALDICNRERPDPA